MNAIVLLFILGTPWLQTGAPADLRVSESIVCDPGCSDLVTALVENRGPGEAEHVVVSFAIPEGAGLQELDVNSACRLTSPGTGNSGAVIVEVNSLAAGQSFVIKARCSTPTTEGWSRSVVFTATSDQSDPTPDDAISLSTLSVPYRPHIDAVRDLASPFRIEIIGSNLKLFPFGKVSVGSCDEVYPSYEESADGTRLVLLGGKDLRRQFPRGEPVVIQILNLQGGYAATTFTRAPSN